MTVKELRAITGLSQRAFGEKYHIPTRTIEDWEGGRRKPSETILYLLERAVKEDYGMTYTYQGMEKIKALRKEIEIIELSDKICEARAKEGKDKIPRDIDWIIEEVKKLNHLDVPSIYSVLVQKEF